MKHGSEWTTQDKNQETCKLYTELDFGPLQRQQQQQWRYAWNGTKRLGRARRAPDPAGARAGRVDARGSGKHARGR
jgi:hypothetical protein